MVTQCYGTKASQEARDVRRAASDSTTGRGRWPLSFVPASTHAAQCKAAEKGEPFNGGSVLHPRLVLLLRDPLPKGTPWWAVLLTRVATLLAWGTAVALSFKHC